MLDSPGPGLLFVLSAPAGTGKTTLVKELLKEFAGLQESVSYTTRLPRPAEIPGVDYHFISEEEFDQRIESGDFLEYVELYGYRYGTSKEWVLSQQKNGKHVVLVIDTQGGLRVKETLPAIFIFLSPPSIEVLRERLEGRGTEDQEEIEKRLAVVRRELEQGLQYDYNVVNEDRHKAYQILRSIFIAELHRIRKQSNFEV